MSATYSPSLGTIPHRAIAWLEQQGTAAEVRLSPWAEAIGVEPVILNGSLEAAIKHGLVVKYPKPGTSRPMYFRLAGEAGHAVAMPIERHMGRPALTHAEVVAMARNGAGAAMPSAVVEQLHVPVFRSAAAAPRSAYKDTPQRGLTAMQARGEVMESEACASATDRGGNAAPARAAGPAFHTTRREGRDVLNAEAQARCNVDSPAASEAPTHRTALNGTAETPAPGQRETASREPCRVARWCDGSVTIERVGLPLQLKLTADEVRKVLALHGVAA